MLTINLTAPIKSLEYQAFPAWFPLSRFLHKIDVNPHSPSCLSFKVPQSKKSFAKANIMIRFAEAPFDNSLKGLR